MQWNADMGVWNGLRPGSPAPTLGGHLLNSCAVAEIYPKLSIASQSVICS